jgi:hypothetical protein
MKTITLKEIISWKPCRDYTDNYNALLLRLAGGATEWPLLDILQRNDIPADDRVWVATRKGVLTDTQRTAWLDVVVTRAVTNHALGTLINGWARRWLSGEDRSEASAVAAQARAAAAWAAKEAMWAAADAARAGARALAEAEAAAWAAASASDAAAWAVAAVAWAAKAEDAVAAAAVWSAARAARKKEREQQVADLIAVLERDVS